MKKTVQEMVALLTQSAKENQLCELEVEENGRRIKVVLSSTPQIVSQTPTHTITPEMPKADVVQEKQNGFCQKSPMVGTVYLSPSPDAEPFVKVGSAVKEGQTILIIEAMKIMNPIVAQKSGTVSKILVQNAEMVEFGQSLVFIDD